MAVNEQQYSNNGTVINGATQVPVDSTTPAVTNEVRDENGMTRNEVFDQLEDDDRVVTSGHGSGISLSGDTGMDTTGYSAGVGSGTSAGDGSDASARMGSDTAD